MNRQEAEQGAKQKAKRPMDLLLIPFIEEKDEAKAQEHRDRLIESVTPLIKKITGGSRRHEDDFQKSVQLALKALWDCKADPVGRAIEDFEHYVAVLAKRVVMGEDIKEREAGGVSDDNEEDDCSLPSSDPKPDEEAEWKEFLEKLWAEIEQLPLRQRRAYLLNFTDGNGQLDLFVFYGVASIRRIGAMLQLSDEHFARLWPELKLSDDVFRLAKSLESYDLKFALLWRYLPLEDLIIARMLGTTRQNVISARDRAGNRLARRMAGLRPTSWFFL